MKTRLLTKKQLPAAAEILSRGGLVAIPTETVYGLAANALDSSVVKKIFKAKKRPAWDPLIVHCHDLIMVKQVAELTSQAEKIAKAFWPGPLTLVLKKKSCVPGEVTSGKKTVGVRIPSHPMALKIIQQAGLPLAAPSANLFGHVSPTTASHVQADLDGRIDAIIDGGKCKVGVESTVLDLTGKIPTILRPGGITLQQLQKYLPRVRTAKKNSGKSPGESLSHYKPKAKLILVKNIFEIPDGKTVGVLAYSQWLGKLGSRKVYNWGSKNQPKLLAARLYDGMRQLDALGARTIYCPLPGAGGLGSAVVNRLIRAAAKVRKV